MKRLLVVAAVALLCMAGAGFTSAVLASAMHRPAEAHRTTPPPTSTTTTPGAALPSQPTTTAPTTTAPTTTTPTTAAAARTIEDPVAEAASVQQAMHAVLPSALVGFEVFDRSTGTVLISQDPGRQFAAMSVVKLLIALDSLARNDWAMPSGATQQQLHQMLADSDDEIASDMWDAAGGPALVSRMVDLLGLTGTRPPEDPGEWGDTLITAQDMVTVYRYITDQLPAPDRDLLITALSDAPHYATDGFDQYFGIPSGMPHATWAIKQGWGTSGSTAVMISTGLVGADLRYVVVLLASASANSYSRVPAVITAGASALADVVSATSP